MDISNILTTIESNPNRTERCIFLCELIIYLKELKNTINFIPNKVDWRNAINQQMKYDIDKSIDKELKLANDILTANLEND